ncbi:hypothetical protein ACJ73_09632 [Blastomyces percursus]|uniref:Uncharacterized protein n=1 Tax=Blastomyces percursus TaxID=1658174 RepID=A0A1J9P4F3_9EURO|nr:hypothetical protein ACJ73_09632 [Blastomyces percursus]
MMLIFSVYQKGSGANQRNLSGNHQGKLNGPRSCIQQLMN